MKQKGFAPIIILVGVFVILTVASGAFYLGRQTTSKSSPNPVITSQFPKISPIPTFQTPQPTVIPSSTSDETANLKTYTNTKYGFSFIYPKDSNFTVQLDNDSEFYLRLTSVNEELDLKVSKSGPTFLRTTSEDISTANNTTWTSIKEAGYCNPDNCNQALTVYVTKGGERYFILILTKITPSSEIFKTVLSNFQINNYKIRQLPNLENLRSCIDSKQKKYSAIQIGPERILISFKDSSLDRAKQIVKSYGLETDGLERYYDFNSRKSLGIIVPLGSEIIWICEFERNGEIKSSEPLETQSISSR